MTRIREWAAVALAVGLVAGATLARADDEGETDKDKPKGPEIAWAKSLAAAKDQAKADHKLIMVDFYTDWCGWCKKLDADTYSDEKVVELSKKLVALKLDAEDEDEGQEAAKAFEVHGYPTILFLDPAGIDGKGGGVVGKIGGYMPPGPFQKQVEQIVANFKEFPELQKKLEQSPDDVPTLGKVIVAYHQRGDDEKASELLDRACKLDPKNADGCLTAALNAVADSHQEKQEFDKAIPLFRKAAETGKTPDEIAYARLSMGICLASQGDLKEAADEFQAVAKLDGAADGDKEQAARLLQTVRRMLDEKAKRDENKDADEDKDEPKP